MSGTDRAIREPAANTNAWVLPTCLCASAVVLSVFQPIMLVAALGALGWTAWAFSVTLRLAREGAESAATRLERAESSLERGRHLQSVLDNASTPIIATDPDGVIMLANQEAARAAGGGRVLTGVRFDELFTESAMHELERLARSGEAGRARLSLPVRGEPRVFIVSAEPIRPANPGVGCVVAMRDVTELVKAGELKADFAANASHELRTPIASIRGAAETLLGPARSDPAMSDRLATMISTNAARLEAMVSDLLDLSRMESAQTPPEVRPMSIRAVFDRQREDFEAVCARRGLSISLEVDPACETILSDPALIDLILRNLIENATKFALEGTTVRVRAVPETVPSDPQRPAPPAAIGETGLRLTVRDKGLGIPLAHQQRIFERFYQVDEARTVGSAQRGTGLGLAIVKHAARQLGGVASVESVYKGGTTMIIELPACVGGFESPPTDPVTGPMSGPASDPGSLPGEEQASGDGIEQGPLG